jgi:hypothetical protein
MVRWLVHVILCVSKRVHETDMEPANQTDDVLSRYYDLRQPHLSFRPT